MTTSVTNTAKPSCVYRTGNLNFAAYLMAAERLKFARVETRGGRFSDFYFHDPNSEGATIESEYIKRDLKVCARTLFDCRARLVREINRAERSK